MDDYNVGNVYKARDCYNVGKLLLVLLEQLAVLAVMLLLLAEHMVTHC